MNRRATTIFTTVAALSLVGCGSDDENNTPPLGGTMSGPVTSSTSSATDDTATTGTPQQVTCEMLDCGLFGTCVEGMEDADATCNCDQGYMLNAAGDGCTVDRSCIKLKSLESGCRQRADGFPAVASFFAVDFCSGDAVLQEDLDILNLEFQVLEGDVDVSDNVEANATIIDKDVESFVALVIDVSQSVAESQDLPLLIDEIRGLVSGLSGSGSEPVYVSVVLFGRTVETLVDFTTDLGSVDTALQQLVTDLQMGNNPINPMGTGLFEAVQVAGKSVREIQKFREAATAGGVLTTGTVVAITDGIDTSGGTYTAVEDTLQVMTIGTSSEVDLDQLGNIGRDGSFLAPTPEDWPASFEAVTTRVDQYPDRTYLLAYCSAATQGTATLQVGLVKPNDEAWGPVQQKATCMFDAGLFAADPPVCNAEQFAAECDDRSCAGLTACGACSDDQCCEESTGACQAPQSVTDVPTGCGSSDELCAPDDQICVADACVDPAASGAACDPGCDTGTTWCDTDTCQPTAALGEACAAAVECQSLHCGDDPTGMAASTICLPPLDAFDACNPTMARCPPGTFCDNTCTPQKSLGENCNTNAQCLSGVCTDSACADGGICHFTWEQAL
jgi:hypothetical protein